MEYNESNFIYLKKTSMEKYYDELVKAEYVCEHFPMITKLIVRKVIEAFLKDVAEKNNIESNVSAWTLLNNIKLSSSISFPEEIYKGIELILINGYGHISRNSINKQISKHPIEILKIIQKILWWYLKRIEIKTMISVKDLNFRALSTIEYMQKEILKINNDILLMDTQINNLRQKIIELSNNPRCISEINNTIILIKKEKVSLEKIQILMNNKIEVQKKQVFDIEKRYKIYIKKIDDLKEKFDENQDLLLEKESQLLKTEIQKQELKILVAELDDEDESIKKMEISLEAELKEIRVAYEHLLNLTDQYQDILETIEFSYDKELQNALEAQKNNIKIKINFEDAIFNDNIIDYNKNIIEAKRKILISKELLNENIKREIKYELVYKGILRLENKELKIIYAIINSVNSTLNLISKPKELLSRLNEEKFLELLSKNFEELKSINDNEIKLVLYYKLIKLSKVSYGKIFNRKRFIKTLDDIVDKAYEILSKKKDFKGRDKKTDAIYTFYMEKVISALKHKNNNLQMTDDLVDKVCKKIIELKQVSENVGKEKIYYNKFNLDNMPEATLKSFIKLYPFDFLAIMVDLASIDVYKDISIILFEIERLIEKKSLIKNFSNEYFIILLFLSSGAAFLDQKQQEELVPLLIMGIMSVSLVADSDVINLENYNDLVELWKYKQQKYNDIFMEKEDKQNNLELLIKERQEIENDYEELLKSHESLLRKYNDYKEEFKNIVMNSEKRILLPSYLNYDELRNKKEIAENHINESKNKFGTLKSMFSLEVWKDQASKFINESNMVEAEKLLIEEAKQKPYFKKEYSVFLDLEGQIKQMNQLINKNKENIKNKDLLIENLKNKVSELQKQLKTIKETYPDIESGSY
jgi:exonuclease SbcC